MYLLNCPKPCTYHKFTYSLTEPLTIYSGLLSVFSFNILNAAHKKITSNYPRFPGFLVWRRHNLVQQKHTALLKPKQRADTMAGTRLQYCYFLCILKIKIAAADWNHFHS